jgi:hypothetical protein
VEPCSDQPRASARSFATAEPSRTLVAAVLVLVPVSASAAADPAYAVSGPCRVRTTESPVSIDRTFDTSFRATLSGPDADVRVTLRGEGLACTLKGKKSGGTVVLAPGQRCKQRVSRDGVRADLNNVLTKGTATISEKTLELSTRWRFDGKVHALFRNMDIKGVMESKAKGALAQQ